MTKSKLKYLLFLAAIFTLVCVCFAGCFKKVDYEAVYNDDAKIATCTSNMQIGSNETTKNGVYNFSCKSFSGVYTMKSITVDEDTAANLTIEVTSGKCKIVLIKGKSVYTLTEGSYDGALDFGMPDGTYKMKIVGVEAKFTLKLSY